MRFNATMMAVAAATIAAGLSMGAPVATAPAQAATAACGHACLEKIGDQYRAAYAARNPKLAPFAAKVRFSENNVEMAFPQASWNAITSEVGPALTYSDTVTGNVAIHTSIMMTNTPAHLAIRLKVINGKITEVEHIMSTKRLISAPPTPFGDIRDIDPEMPTVLKPSERVSRAEMIRLADGYFKTLSQNDGQIFTKFNANCHRVENGFETAKDGCDTSFKNGNFAFNERVRREWIVVDEEKGLIMGRGFIDHRGVMVNYKLTNGQDRVSPFQEPHTWSMLESFKIKNGGLGPVIATFIGAPYRVQSPYTNPAKVNGEKSR